MTWILEQLGAYYSRFSPEPDMDHWDAALERHFESLSDEEKSRYGRRSNTYVIAVQSKLRYAQGDAMAEGEWSEVIRLKRTYKSLPDLFYVLYGLMMVSAPMRDLLEEFDPGVHVFRDIPFDYETDQPYFAFWTPSNLQAIYPEASDPKCVKWSEDGKNYRSHYGEIGCAGIVFDESKTEGREFWRDSTLHIPCYCISDDFKTALKERGLSFPKVYKTKATV